MYYLKTTVQKTFLVAWHHTFFIQVLLLIKKIDSFSLELFYKGKIDDEIIQIQKRGQTKQAMGSDYDTR